MQVETAEEVALSDILTPANDISVGQASVSSDFQFETNPHAAVGAQCTISAAGDGSWVFVFVWFLPFYTPL